MKKWAITCLLITLFFILVICSGGKAADVSLKWLAPTTNEDGSPLTDLAGFKIYYGIQSGEYDAVITLEDIFARDYTVTGLLPDQLYYFVATAFNIARYESAYSNEISKPSVEVITPTEPPIIIGNILHSNMNTFPDDISVGKSTYKIMSIRNDYFSQVVISQVIVQGDFKVTTTFPKTIMPGKTLTFRVYFQPSDKGLRNGSVEILTDKGILIKFVSGYGK
jgi:hypothetical protein